MLTSGFIFRPLSQNFLQFIGLNLPGNFFKIYIFLPKKCAKNLDTCSIYIWLYVQPARLFIYINQWFSILQSSDHFHNILFMVHFIIWNAIYTQCIVVDWEISMQLSHIYIYIYLRILKKELKNKYLNYQPSVFYKEAVILINVHIFLMNTIAAKKER